jgi:chromosome segregation ATPase
MAITETTKQVILAHKNILKSRLAALKEQKQEHLAAAATLQAQMDAIKTEIDALQADIPEPVQVEL